jgi:hypothetical protein
MGLHEVEALVAGIDYIKYDNVRGVGIVTVGDQTHLERSTHGLTPSAPVVVDTFSSPAMRVCWHSGLHYSLARFINRRKIRCKAHCHAADNN